MKSFTFFLFNFWSVVLTFRVLNFSWINYNNAKINMTKKKYKKSIFYIFLLSITFLREILPIRIIFFYIFNSSSSSPDIFTAGEWSAHTPPLWVFSYFRFLFSSDYGRVYDGYPGAGISRLGLFILSNMTPDGSYYFSEGSIWYLIWPNGGPITRNPGSWTSLCCMGFIRVVMP